MTQINIEREVISMLKPMEIAEKAITDETNFNKDLGLDSTFSLDGKRHI